MVQRLFHRLPYKKFCHQSLNNMHLATFTNPDVVDGILYPQKILAPFIPKQLGVVAGTISSYVVEPSCFEAVELLVNAFGDKINLNTALRCVSLHPMLYSILPEEIRSNLALAHLAITKNALNKQHLPPLIQDLSIFKGEVSLVTSSNEKFILDRLKYYDLEIPHYFRSIYKFAQKAVRIRGRSLRFFDLFQNNEALIIAALKNDITATEFVEVKILMRRKFHLYFHKAVTHSNLKLLLRLNLESLKERHWNAIADIDNVKIIKYISWCFRNGWFQYENFFYFIKSKIEASLGDLKLDALCKQWNVFDDFIFDALEVHQFSFEDKESIKLLIHQNKSAVLSKKLKFNVK